MEKERNRVLWIDTAKGIGMILVILGHVLTAFSRQINNTDIFNALPVKVIVSFNMPLFFFLSGIFIKSTLKKSFSTIFIDKFKRLMIPYFCWGIVSVIFFSLYTHVSPIIRIVELPIRPIFVLWFVYSMFISMIAFYILEKNLNRYIILILSVILFFVGQIITDKYGIAIDSYAKPIIGFCRNFVFMYLGFMMHKIIYVKRENKITVGLIIISAVIVVFLNSIELSSIYVLQINQMFISLAGIVLICTVSYIISDNKLIQSTVTFIGTISMEVYLIHKIVVEIVSVVLIHLTTNVYIFSVLNVITTLIICLVIRFIIDYFHLGKVFFGYLK
ncbi:acyltransferase [Latilactobacillus curvatus]|uniref:acyltransferase family protein n=1 Tax=Latilactobacillus curvatus TaxID=28038 RepID=UPI00241132B2|nr:acyltransferase [Latilactobacillus curvatus]MDG2978930.1 acyltransferase [Latilactobacillus curvatus]